MDALGLEVGTLLRNLGMVLGAGVLALPIALEREIAERTAGLRTFPVVAVASCAFVLIGHGAFPGNEPAQARILQGLLSGMGFIGGGAILKERNREDGTVIGIATAASLWNTGAIGAAVAYRRFDLAVVLAVVNFLILRFIKPAALRDDTQHGGG